ncbi:MAG: disulfide bond formation protein B [Reyranella sp.]|nr:disulfide bond formation protein B [Reyranella sp.]
MASLVRLGNAIGAIGIATLLLAAFGMQFVLGELPCPLCVLQRIALVLCGFGFLLNLRFGVQPLHYGLTILAALYGAMAAGRQVLLHIVPGTGAYGSPLFGLHLYTWSLIVFGGVIVGVAVLMIMGGRPDHDRSDHQAATRFRGIHRFAAWLLIAVTLANALNSFVLCGPVECDSDPAGYWIAKYLP